MIDLIRRLFGRSDAPPAPDPARVLLQARVPDLGEFRNVPVITVHVAPGDVVGEDDPLVMLESDKATMDVPAPAAGTIVSLVVKVGDAVSEGTVVALLEPMPSEA